MKCRLCGEPALPLIFASRKSATMYLKCEVCGFVGLAARHMLSQKEGKNRYLLHENSPTDLGYLGFLKVFIESAVLPYTIPGCRILDYGSGPRPVLSGMLDDMGYECDIYDPAFAKTRLWKKKKYSAVLLHEVAEHLKNPGATFASLLDILEPGGIIAIRTRFLPPDADDLKSWWYRMDPTHISLFTPQSLVSFFGQKGFLTLCCMHPDILVFRKNAG